MSRWREKEEKGEEVEMIRERGEEVGGGRRE